MRQVLLHKKSTNTDIMKETGASEQNAKKEITRMKVGRGLKPAKT